jgi:hypothetical protein
MNSTLFPSPASLLRLSVSARSFLFLCVFSFAAHGQAKLDKTIPVKAGQQVRFHFDYPELIRVSTWDRNEVSIQGTVSINDGENDDAFGLEVNMQGGYVDVRGKIKDMDNLPHRITVVEDGVKRTFRNEAEWRKYKKENGKTRYNTINQGVEIDITLEIKVPAGMQTTVLSTYGMVEVSTFDGPLRVEATYGGIDVSLMETATGEVVAETNYGHIYSDLTAKFDSGTSRDEDFHTLVSAKPGKGPSYRFESAYGSIYLRRRK